MTSSTPNYQPGDIVNGHVLRADGTWMPLPAAAPAPPQYVGPSGPVVSVASVPVETNHTFHLLMSVFTCGLWALFVWLPMALINSMRKRKIVTRHQ